MKKLNHSKNLKRFYLSWQKLNYAYEEYAKQHGLTYISLFILQLIEDGVTQKEICDILYFPKQTVNKVILSFEKKELIKLAENSQDKRSRIILLTEKGREFQNQVIPTINQAEFTAFASLSADEQSIMTELWEIYRCLCNENHRKTRKEMMICKEYGL